MMANYTIFLCNDFYTTRLIPMKKIQVHMSVLPQIMEEKLEVKLVCVYYRDQFFQKSEGTP